MENVIAIGAGLVLRSAIDLLTDSDHRLTSTLVGLWEGIVLSHFLHKYPRNPNDAYLALVTRFAIDFMLTNSLVRFVLTGVWTLVGLLLADIAPSVWRDTGLRHVYRTLRKDYKAMRRTVPRWRIENDIQVPNISISNPVPGLFSRPPPSTIVSSTRAVPPASPAPIRQRRSPSGTPSSQVTPSETNTLTREVLPGPSPAFIHTDVDPVFSPSLNPDSDSHRTSLLSNVSDPDPSMHDRTPIPDDTTVPPYTQEQEQEHDPDLSALNLTPPVATVEVTATNLTVLSPTPRSRIEILPHIPDSEIDLSIHTPQVLLPESRPTSRVRSVVSAIDAGIWSQNARARAGEVGSDQGLDLGKVYMPFMHRASSTGVLGQTQNHLTSGNRSSSTGHHSSSKWPNSMVRRSEETIVSAGAAGTEASIGESAVQADRQMPQRSGTPKVQSGSGSMRVSSALGSSTLLSPSKIPTTLPDSKPTPAPYTKPPTPAPVTRLTTPAPHPKSSTAGPPSQPLTLTPVPYTKTPTPKPKPTSRSTTPSGTNRTSGPNPANTDYDPADPIRPMKSPSTIPDSIFPGPGARAASATGQYDLFDTSRDAENDPPPPFKEFESPVCPPEGGFSARVGEVNENVSGGGGVVEGSRGEGSGADPALAKGDVEGEGQEGIAKEEGQGAATNENIGNVDGEDRREVVKGSKETFETSQDPGEHTQGAGQSTSERGEGAREEVGDSQEQETSKKDEANPGTAEDVHGAGNDSQARGEDTKLAGADTQIAGDGTQGAGGDTQVAGGDTEDAGMDTPVAGGDAEGADAESSLEPEPTGLTPEQAEAETHRVAFLHKERARLETLQKRRDYSDGQDPSEIQARLDAVKGRISRTVFADPPKDPSPAPEVTSSGKPVTELPGEVATLIIDLLINRQDAGPIVVNVSSPTKKREKAVALPLKEFITENKFSIRSDSTGGQFVTVITV